MAVVHTPNPEKGEFALKLGGHELIFKINTSALIACQEALAVNGVVPPVPEIMAGVYGGTRLAYARAFLWAGLRKFHQEYTIEAVGELIDESNEQEIKVLLQRLGLTFPDPKDHAALAPKKARGKANPQKAQTTAGTGGNSTSRPAASA